MLDKSASSGVCDSLTRARSAHAITAPAWGAAHLACHARLLVSLVLVEAVVVLGLPLALGAVGTAARDGVLLGITRTISSERHLHTALNSGANDSV